MLIVLKSQKKHFWYSCNIIEEHTMKALESSDFHYEVMTCDQCLSDDQLGKLRHFDEKIHLFLLSGNLDYEHIAKQVQPFDHVHFILQILGNFTGRPQRWFQLESLLENKPVSILGASTRSCQQIQKFMSRPDLWHIPYPIVPPKNFEITSEDSEIHLLFAGRLTLQKNILGLLKAFQVAARVNKNIKLHIAGDYFYPISPFHSIGYEMSFFQAMVQKYLNISKERVIYHGNLSQDELSSLMWKMDYFCSLSVHHDEDFSVSVAQALGHRLGLILSDWGGHSSYFEKTKYVHKIPVHVSDRLYPEVDWEILVNILKSLKKHPKAKEDEVDTGFLSYESFNMQLSSLMSSHEKRDYCLDPLFFRYFHMFNETEGSPFALDEAKSYEEVKKLYYDIYETYLKDFSPHES